MKFSLLTAILIASSAAVSVNGLELSPSNYETETSGKTVFLKFFAPW